MSHPPHVRLRAIVPLVVDRAPVEPGQEFDAPRPAAEMLCRRGSAEEVLAVVESTYVAAADEEVGD